jgi:hypothetical protein
VDRVASRIADHFKQINTSERIPSARPHESPPTSKPARLFAPVLFHHSACSFATRFLASAAPFVVARSACPS